MIIRLSKFLTIAWWMVALNDDLRVDSFSDENEPLQQAAFKLVKSSRVRRQTSIDTCVNARTVDSSSAVQFTAQYARIERPWTSNSYPNAQLHTGPNLLYNWELMKSTRIRGMDTTLSKLLYLYDINNCLFVAWGRAVRNLVMSEKETLPIFGETNCTVYRIYKICKSLFRVKNCHVIDDGTAVLIGNLQANRSVPGESLLEPIRLYTWQSLWEPRVIQREFTVNVMGLYDNYAGQVSVIDLTGTGFEDACHRQIRSAGANPTEWHDWTLLLRYVEATIFGLIAPNDVLGNFVRAEIRRHYNKAAFQAFLCESVYEGIHLAGMGGATCAASAERVGELKADRMTRLRAVIDHMFTHDGEPADDFYNDITIAMTTIKFTVNLPNIQPLPDGAPTPTAATERIKFIHSHRPQPMPTALTVAHNNTRRSPVDERGDLPPPPPRIPYITPRPSSDYRRPAPAVVVRFVDGEKADNSGSEEIDQSMTDWPLSVEMDEAASRAVDSDEAVRTRLGAPAGHPLRRRPFGIVVFGMTTPFNQFSLRTHPTGRDSAPIRL